MNPEHIPVLYQSVLTHLQPQAGGWFVDGTLGAGGHAAGLLQASGPDGRLLGLDADPEAVERARQALTSFGKRVALVNSSFRQLKAVAAARQFFPVDGILLDLGLSGFQLASSTRGFSFLKDGPLDMRFDFTQGPTAADLLNSASELELAQILYRFGEEKQSRRIAQAIVKARPLHTTLELVEVVNRAVGARRGRLHPATHTFQALRIAVNDELSALEAVLPQALDLLKPGGRLAIISFHSLEDRLVKQLLRRESQDCLCPAEQPVCTCAHRASLKLITRRPLCPDAAEIAHNPRARSARLRVAEKKANDAHF